MTIFSSVADVAVLFGLTLWGFVDVVSGAMFMEQRAYLNAEWYLEAKKYTKLTKRLPPWFFGAMWTALYILIIASLYIVFLTVEQSGAFGQTLDIIGMAALVNLFLNKLWTPVFFTWHMPWAALFIVVCLNALNGLIQYYMWAGGYYPNAFWIYFPYTVWCVVAFCLNCEWLWAESKMRRRHRHQGGNSETVVVVEEYSLDSLFSSV